MNSKNWKVPGTDILYKNKVHYVADTDIELNLWQCCVVYNRKVGIMKKSIPFMFYSSIVNNSKEQCLAYAPYYINKLIQQGDLPEDVIVNGEINEKIIKVAVVELTLANMERDVSDR